MPRFYFDTFDGHEEQPDLEGLDYPDRASARSDAASALADMARDALPDGTKHTFKVQIRDERGQWFEGTLHYSGRDTRQN